MVNLKGIIRAQRSSASTVFHREVIDTNTHCFSKAHSPTWLRQDRVESVASSTSLELIATVNSFSSIEFPSQGSLKYVKLAQIGPVAMQAVYHVISHVPN